MYKKNDSGEVAWILLETGDSPGVIFYENISIGNKQDAFMEQSLC